MDVNLLFKIAAFLVSLTGLVIVLFWIVPYIYDLFDKIKNLFSL